MTRTQSNFLMVVGFFLTFGAVGGIDRPDPAVGKKLKEMEK